MLNTLNQFAASDTPDVPIPWCTPGEMKFSEKSSFAILVRSRAMAFKRLGLHFLMVLDSKFAMVVALSADPIAS